jgi:hypothetical protein
MELTEENTADKLGLKGLREMGRDEIAELVAAGLLPADLADEIQSEDEQKKEDQQAADNRQRLQVQDQQAEQQEDDDWLHKMSQSYQQAYNQLMDTYDDAESEYDTIKSRAEKLKESLWQKVETARQHGISLSDGEQAFFDKKTNSFVNGSLQPLSDSDAKEAAADFKLLTPQQQKANACYVDAYDAYNEVADISQMAQDGNKNIQIAKQKLADSQGTITEAQLNEMGTTVKTQTAGLADRLNKAENADAGFDEVLSADTDASTTAPNGNGKTTALFNTVANSAPASDLTVANTVPTLVNRLPLTPAP